MPINMNLLTKSGKQILPVSVANILYSNLFNSTHKQYQSLNVANTTETLWFENHKIFNAKYVTDEATSLFLKRLLFVQGTHLLYLANISYMICVTNTVNQHHPTISSNICCTDLKYKYQRTIKSHFDVIYSTEVRHFTEKTEVLWPL